MADITKTIRDGSGFGTQPLKSTDVESVAESIQAGDDASQQEGTAQEKTDYMQVSSLVTESVESNVYEGVLSVELVEGVDGTPQSAVLTSDALMIELATSGATDLLQNLLASKEVFVQLLEDGSMYFTHIEDATSRRGAGLGSQTQSVVSTSLDIKGIKGVYRGRVPIDIKPASGTVSVTARYFRSGIWRDAHLEDNTGLVSGSYSRVWWNAEIDLPELTNITKLMIVMDGTETQYITDLFTVDLDVATTEGVGDINDGTSPYEGSSPIVRAVVLNPEGYSIYSIKSRSSQHYVEELDRTYRTSLGTITKSGTEYAGGCLRLAGTEPILEFDDQRLETTDLLAAYHFDDSEAIDWAGHRLSNANSVTSTTDKRGDADKAFNLNGSSSSVNIPYPYINLQSQYTVTAHFYYPLNASATTWNVFCEGPSYSVVRRRSDGRLGILRRSDSYFWYSTYNMNLSTGWHTLTVLGERSSGETHFYVDGVWVTRIFADFETQIRYIGNYSGGSRQWGILDEFRIYNGHLTTDQMLLLKDGRVYENSTGYATDVIDAGTDVNWHSMDYYAYIPANTSLQVRVRTSLDQDGVAGLEMNDWEVIEKGSLTQDRGRYLEWRIDLTSSSDRALSPRLYQIKFTNEITAYTHETGWVDIDLNSIVYDTYTDWNELTQFNVDLETIPGSVLLDEDIVPSEASTDVYWKLDETMGAVADDAVGSFDGTVQGAPTWGTGQINNCLVVNAAGGGAAQIFVIDAGSFGTTGPFAEEYLWGGDGTTVLKYSTANAGGSGPGTGYEGWTIGGLPTGFSSPEIFNFMGAWYSYDGGGYAGLPFFTGVATLTNGVDGMGGIYYTGMGAGHSYSPVGGALADWVEHTSFTLTATCSISFWMISTAGDTAQRKWFGTTSGAPGTGVLFIGEDASGDVYVNANNGSGLITYVDTSWLSAFTHWVVTIDTSGGVIKLYKNGSYVAQDVSYTHSAWETGIVAGVFVGKIDEVRAHNRVLNATEVSDLYTNNIIYDAGYKTQGYVSAIADAGRDVSWGKFEGYHALDVGTDVLYRFRSSTEAEGQGALSGKSLVTAGTDDIPSVDGRYLECRVQLDGDGEHTPEVEKLTMWLVDNKFFYKESTDWSAATLTDVEASGDYLVLENVASVYDEVGSADHYVDATSDVVWYYMISDDRTPSDSGLSYYFRYATDAEGSGALTGKAWVALQRSNIKGITARYMAWRVVFTANTDRDETPVLRRLILGYGDDEENSVTLTSIPTDKMGNLEARLLAKNPVRCVEYQGTPIAAPGVVDDSIVQTSLSPVLQWTNAVDTDGPEDVQYLFNFFDNTELEEVDVIYEYTKLTDAEFGGYYMKSPAVEISNGIVVNTGTASGGAIYYRLDGADKKVWRYFDAEDNNRLDDDAYYVIYQMRVSDNQVDWTEWQNVTPKSQIMLMGRYLDVRIFLQQNYGVISPNVSMIKFEAWKGADQYFVEEGGGSTTDFDLSVRGLLTHNEYYNYRVKAFDGAHYSLWSRVQAIQAVETSEPDAPTDLESEDLVDPQFLVTFSPDFTWAFNDLGGRTQQSARVQVGTSSGLYDMWDSGKLDTTAGIEYGELSLNEAFAPEDLARDTVYYWRVRTWNDLDLAGAYSTEAEFRLNLLATIPDPDTEFCSSSSSSSA